MIVDDLVIVVVLMVVGLVDGVVIDTVGAAATLVTATGEFSLTTPTGRAVEALPVDRLDAKTVTLSKKTKSTRITLAVVLKDHRQL
jgi:hypothetical protein